MATGGNRLVFQPRQASLDTCRLREENFEASGFTFETVRPVDQRTCSSIKELAARTDTTLALLTDEEFRHRQTALEDAAAREIESIPVIGALDLLVLRKSG